MSSTGERARHDPAELVRLHVQALFTSDTEGRLLAVNEAGGGPAPRFFLARMPEGHECRFRNDVDARLADELALAAAAMPKGMENDAAPELAAPFAALLERTVPVSKTWMGPALAFPAVLPEHEGIVQVTESNGAVLERYFEDWLGDVGNGAPFTAVLEDGDAVSICCSVRVSEGADEAGIETHPDFRGRGYAVRAAAAWAVAVRGLGRVPLYSTSWGNHASRSVARKLGLIQYGSTLHCT